MAKKKVEIVSSQDDYDSILSDLSGLIIESRKMAACSVNEIMFDTYSKLGVKIPSIDKASLENSVSLKFLGLKDEFKGKSLKGSYLIRLEDFFLKHSFSVVSQQKKVQIGDEWHCVDLLLFNRRLRCLVIIDLKIGELDHADIGQMLLYTNYSDEHWRIEDENPSIGLILCAEKDEALAHYTLENLSDKILAKEYKTVLPDEKILVREIEKTRKMLENRK